MEIEKIINITKSASYAHTPVNFRAIKTEQDSTTKPKTVSQKGMSNTMKVGIGLSALATIIIAGFAIKKGLSKSSVTTINSKQMFEIAFGKINSIDGELKKDEVISCAKNMVAGDREKQILAIKLDDKGLEFFKEKMNVNISKDIFGKKKALLLMLSDKDSNLIKSKPFMADSFEESLSNMFGDKSIVHFK